MTSDLAAAVQERVDYRRFLDCVHCGLCTSACPTYLETGNENDNPRGRIYLMRAVADRRIELSETVQRHLDLCLDCRACETACPSGVQYGHILEPFRAAVREHGAGVPRRRGLQRLLLRHAVPYPRRLAAVMWPLRLLPARLLERLAPAGMRRLLRQLPGLPPPLPRLPRLLPAAGPRRARVALFRGCVADVLFRRVHWATAAVLQANGCEVVVPPDQLCCGALSHHAGERRPALSFARRNAAAFSAAGLDAVVVNVAGCGAMLKDYAALDPALSSFAGRVRDVHEFLLELGPLAPRHPLALRAVYADACHLLHAQRIGEAPLRLLAMVSGLELLPLTETEICCGAAGSYALTEPEMSDLLARRKAQHLVQSGAAAVISANAGCALQIQAALREAGRPLPVFHPMELLARAYDPARAPGRT